MPERTAVSLSTVTFEYDEGSIGTIYCDASQISILLNSPILSTHLDAKMHANLICGMFVSAFGFSLGRGYSIEITQVTDENGVAAVFGVAPPNKRVNENLEFDTNEDIFHRSLKLSSENIFFRFAMRDYTRAILDEIDCAYYCYRAIESIKTSFETENTLDGWEVMHQKLGTSAEEIITKIKHYADPTRHGNWVKVRDTNVEIRWDILAYTKELLHKYLVYYESTNTSSKTMMNS